MPAHFLDPATGEIYTRTRKTRSQLPYVPRWSLLSQSTAAGHAKRKANVAEPRGLTTLVPDPAFRGDPRKNKGIRVRLTDMQLRREATAGSPAAKKVLIKRITGALSALPMQVLVSMDAVCYPLRPVRVDGELRGGYVCCHCLRPYKPKRANAPEHCCYRPECRDEAEKLRNQERYPRERAKRKAARQVRRRRQSRLAKSRII
jgi:hypothetical protein